MVTSSSTIIATNGLQWPLAELGAQHQQAYGGLYLFTGVSGVHRSCF